MAERGPQGASFSGTVRALQRRRWILVALLGLGITLALGVAAWRAQHTGPVVLRLGAGHPSDEGYAVAAALAATADLYEPGVRIRLVETEGSEDSARRLAAGELELAAVQADIDLPTDAALVSVLYQDIYLLLTSAGSPLSDVSQLAGHRIGVADHGSGQHRSLERLLAHYALEDAVKLTHAPEAEADRLLRAGGVDVVFRVRSAQNPGVRALVAALDLKLLRIGQAPALHLHDPALQPGEVPEGALRGGPPVPAQATPTVVVDRLLVARADVPAVAVEALARILFERRQALARHTPLAAGIHVPGRETVLAAPLHGGVLAWLERDEPSYLERNADYVSLLLSVVLLAGSWVWAARSYLARRMQRRADHYNHVLVEILHAIDAAEVMAQIEALKARLLHILEEVMDDVEEERITPTHFQGFALAWRAAHDTLRDRERSLLSAR